MAEQARRQRISRMVNQGGRILFRRLREVFFPATSATLEVWRGSQVVRPSSAKALCAGSIPARASKEKSVLVAEWQQNGSRNQFPVEPTTLFVPVLATVVAADARMFQDVLRTVSRGRGHPVVPIGGGGRPRRAGGISNRSSPTKRISQRCLPRWDAHHTASNFTRPCRILGLGFRGGRR